jgi:hypothetical protein
MRERIVYVLGAGFSAPLGLPLVGNFITMSKDLYFGNPRGYPHFSTIYDQFGKMASAKNYYTANLLSIEEVLSILEMESTVTGDSETRDRFIQFLKDTITFYTPKFEGSIWDGHFRTSAEGLVCAFLASMTGFRATRYKHGQDERFCLPPSSQYALISLNYDLVLERALNVLSGIPFAQREGIGHSQLDFQREGTGFRESQVALAKLHGSVDSNIVPPTWNKMIQEEVGKAWHLAYTALSDATQIRIIGYSLPIMDSYVRYLFKAAILRSQHLKHIDIICLDDGGVRDRYCSFVSFPSARFIGDKGVGEYFEALGRAQEAQESTLIPPALKLSFPDLDDLHKKFFLKNGTPLHQG